MPKTIYCPYYKYDVGSKIVCEEGVQKLGTEQRRKGHVRKYCGDLERWPLCRHAQKRERFYQREGRG